MRCFETPAKSNTLGVGMLTNTWNYFFKILGTIMTLTKCSECGQVIADDDSYYQKCGHQVQVDASDNSQVKENQTPEQVDYSWDNDDSSNHPMLWALLAVVALAIIGGVAWYLNQGTPNVETEEEVLLDTVPDMAAPVIELNADGVYTINDCPTTYEGLQIVKKRTLLVPSPLLTL